MPVVLSWTFQKMNMIWSVIGPSAEMVKFTSLGPQLVPPWYICCVFFLGSDSVITDDVGVMPLVAVALGVLVAVFVTAAAFCVIVGDFVFVGVGVFVGRGVFVRVAVAVFVYVGNSVGVSVAVGAGVSDAKSAAIAGIDEPPVTAGTITKAAAAARIRSKTTIPTARQAVRFLAGCAAPIAGPDATADAGSEARAVAANAGATTAVAATCTSWGDCRAALNSPMVW